MEKMIVTEYGRPIMMQKVKEFVQRTMFLAEDKVIPYAVFALLNSGEMVNIGNFDDADTAEIIRIILDIFAEDKKAVFDVNLEVFGIKKFLEMLRYVSVDSDSVFRRKEELESFFLSEWFRLLSGLDGRYFIQKMQEVYYFDR